MPRLSYNGMEFLLVKAVEIFFGPTEINQQSSFSSENTSECPKGTHLFTGKDGGKKKVGLQFEHPLNPSVPSSSFFQWNILSTKVF